MQRPRDALTLWDDPASRALLELLRDPPPTAGALGSAGARARLLHTAEQHGLGGVALDRFRAAGVELPEGALAREVARELDHEAHLATVREIDDAFGREGLRGVVLKGAVLAARLYPRPASRSTSDIDLLVAEADLERAARVLAPLGWRGETGAEEERFRREHFHLHFARAGSPPLEVHFHAYRGFGRVFRSEPILARAVAALDLAALGVPAPEDEITYLAAHAAAHRFVRIGWLYDLVLLVMRSDRDALRRARENAAEHGFARVLAFTAALLEEQLGCTAARDLAEDASALERARQRVVSAITEEPRRPVARSLTRFVYTALLCDSAAAAARYAREASAQRARLALGGHA